MHQPNLFPEERRNTGLFSQYYLEEVLLQSLPSFATDRDRPAPVDLGLDYFEQKFNALEPIIRENEELAGKRNEAQIEEDVIRKILTQVLGHVYDVQVTHKGDKPDYFFFSAEEDKQAAKKLNAGSTEFTDLAMGILDAKAWKKSSRAGVAAEASISQIYRYLINFNQRWGILTDGFRWLLFSNRPGIRQDQYLEFDLAQIVKNKEKSKADNFKLFILLFRREAFERRSDSRALLDDVLEESIQKAAKLQDDLKQKVYEAFQIVAEEYRRRERLKLETEAALEELKEASLIFLYRILFLLYGESRVILPVRPTTEEYYTYSLERLLLEQIDEDAKRIRPQQNSLIYWHRLNDLFELIHGLEEDGSRLRLGEDIGLLPYNGGLFDPRIYKNVSKWKLGDKAIKAIMDLLTKTGERRNAKPVRVDYRDLGVQHLGNIYEGILENRLVLEDGQVKVHTDNGERKATGSYYTPDYIVDYIVEQTLGPIIEEAVEQIVALKKEKRAAAFEEELLKLKVLDPAMGSGHFLIGAIDYLAEKLAKKNDAATIYTEVELQECRRLVAERCIYGVDLNPMAVELAKLSIWLHTLSESKPLTFLDNHIKCGNALIGARIADLNSPSSAKRRGLGGGVPGEPEGQPNLFPENFLTQDVHNWLEAGRIFTTPSNDIANVKAKEALENDLDEKRKPYKAIADFWTSLYFTNVSLSDASAIMRELGQVRDARHPNLAKYAGELAEAEKIAKEKHFFHWELEFPEIFFDKAGRLKGEEGGFDVVMSNPPYVRQETLGKTKELYYQYTYSTYSNTADLYVYFYELGKRNLRQDGRLGFITSNKFIRSTYGKPLRNFLKAQVALKEIIDFGELRVFEEAAAMPVVVVVANGYAKEQSFNFTQVKSLDFDKLKTVIASSSMRLGESALEGENWSLSSNEVLDVFHKMKSRSLSLGEYCNHKIFYGIKTGLNEAFVIDQAKRDELIKRDSRSIEIVKPFIVGDDVRKYKINFENRYLIWTYIDVPIDSYPAIFEHLKQFQPQLETRQDQGKHWWELRACAYYDEFQKPKIIFPDIAKTNRFTFDKDGLFVANTAYILPLEDLYLLSVLNSCLILQYYKRNSMVLGDPDKGGRMRWIYQDVARIPIRTISFTTPKKTREKLTRELIARSEKAIGGVSEAENDEAIRNTLQPVIALAREYSEEKNDVVHDFLSHLAEQMIAMNKEKQKLAEDFFTWMGHYGIPPREEMKPKMFLDEFWEKEFKIVLTHLKRNKVKLTTQDEDRLLDRFNTSSNTLLLFDRKIELTDWLIDQVVYALYGLTEEEIAIVEGSTILARD